MDRLNINEIELFVDISPSNFNNSHTPNGLPAGRSSTIHPQSTPLTLDGTALKESADLAILGDAKMTFEKHLRSVFRAAAQRLGIIRNFWKVFHD